MSEATGGPSAALVRIARADAIPAALDSVGLTPDRAVLVLVGGAGGMGESALAALAEAMRDAVLPAVERHDAVVIDGGTDVGVMRLIGRARAAAGGRFPLVGVAAEGMVIVPGVAATSSDAAELEPNHTHFLLVPGTEWGDETQWITDVAGAVAGGRSSVTVLVNGGEIAYTDVAGSLAVGRPVVVLAGSGRTADVVAGARAGHDSDPRAIEIAASPLTWVADIGQPGAVAAAIEAALDASWRPAR